MTIQVKLHHEDPSSCKTVFVLAHGTERKYFNRHDDGSWYTCHPKNGYWESDTPVKPEVVFAICNPDGTELFRDSNGMEKAFFLSPSRYVSMIAAHICRKLKLHSYEYWAHNLDRIRKERFQNRDRDNWLFGDAKKMSDEEVLRFKYFGIRYTLVKSFYVHSDAAASWWAYTIDSDSNRYAGEIVGFSDLSVLQNTI